MRLEFKEHDSDFEVRNVAHNTLESFLIPGGIQKDGVLHQFYGCIDGVPTTPQSGFPEPVGWDTALREVLQGFLSARTALLQNILQFTVESTDRVTRCIHGSFFIRVPNSDFFLEINFREDYSGDEPLTVADVLSPLNRIEDYSFPAIIAASQLKLGIETGAAFGDLRVANLANNIQQACMKFRSSNEGRKSYWLEKGSVDLFLRRILLMIRREVFKMSLARTGFEIQNGTLGPALRRLVQDFLVEGAPRI